MSLNDYLCDYEVNVPQFKKTISFRIGTGMAFLLASIHRFVQRSCWLGLTWSPLQGVYCQQHSIFL